jgi:hypothetical protein
MSLRRGPDIDPLGIQRRSCEPISDTLPVAGKPVMPPYRTHRCHHEFTGPEASQASARRRHHGDMKEMKQP